MSEKDTQLHDLTLKDGDIFAERFLVLRRLGSGGMGVVFLVADTQLAEQHLALKILHRSLAKKAEVSSRFRNEVLVARSLSHPNVIRTYDFGKAPDGTAYISMEFVEGTSLRELIAERGRIPFLEACAMLLQILRGVSYAHEQGVVHRDLKPANVMITARGVAKLGDFGTARVVQTESELTQKGQILGTLGYMAPEQIKGERANTASDIYALGIIAYEMVTGENPFFAKSDVEVAMKQLEEPLPDASSITPEVPKWYVSFTKRATQKERAKRFESVAEMLACLEEQLEKETEVRTRERSLRRFSGVFTGIIIGALLGYISLRPPEIFSTLDSKPDGAEVAMSATETMTKSDQSEEPAFSAEEILNQRLQERVSKRVTVEAPKMDASSALPYASLDEAAAIFRQSYSSASESKQTALRNLLRMEAEDELQQSVEKVTH